MTSTVNDEPLLAVKNLRAGYGSLSVLHEVSFQVRTGEVVALVGANGAGKTTTLRCISGLMPPTSGSIRFRGERIDGLAPHRIVERGLVQVPEGRMLFPAMTVRENLMMGAYLPRPRDVREADLADVLELFPDLRAKLASRAGSLSGGQQQMVAIGRALMAKPKLLILDEPSLGLAPLVVRDIFAIIERLVARGLAILVVEQNIANVLAIASRGWVLENGRVALEGTGKALLGDARVRASYLGLH
jgi:branched-chain amino acid transport system ATP-binding protein